MVIGLLVLGMHRSGTSAVTGLLAESGFVAGVGADVMPAREDNPAGFFERLSVVAYDDGLLAAAGGAWDAPPPRAAVSGDVAPLLERLTSEGLPLVVKDPRICLLMRVWSTPSLAPVLVVRNPLEIARSLQQRDGMPIPVGLALWEVYTAAALDGLQGQWTYVVSYDDVLADPQRFVDDATTLLDHHYQERVKPWSGRSIDGALRHQRAASDDVAACTTPSQAALWAHLQTLSGAALLSTPEALRAEPTTALEVLAGWAALRSGRVELEARATAAAEQVDALHAEVAARDAVGVDLRARVAELETAFELVAEQAERQHAQITDLGEKLGDVEGLNALLHEAKDRAEAGYAELLEQHRAAVAELEAVKSSESWRVGQALVKPLGRLRRT